MSHPRTLIRQAIVNQLKGQTEADQKVYGLRNKKFNYDDLPILLVYTPEEEVDENEYLDQEIRKRDVLVYIYYSQSGGDDLEDQIDAAAETIEGVVDNLDLSQGPIESLSMVRSEIDFLTYAEGSAAFVLLVYKVSYLG